MEGYPSIQRLANSPSTLPSLLQTTSLPVPWEPQSISLYFLILPPIHRSLSLRAYIRSQCLIFSYVKHYNYFTLAYILHIIQESTVMSINHTNCPRFKIKVITNNGVKLICPIDREESIGTLYLNIQELYKDIMIEDHSQCQPFSVSQLQKYDYRLSRTQIVGDVLNDGDQLTCIIEQKVKASKSQIKKGKKLEKERKASISKQKKIEEGEKTSQKTKQSKKTKTKLSDKVMKNLMVSLKDSFKPNQQTSLSIKNKQNDSRRESPKPTQYLFVEEQESPIVKEQNQPQSLLP